MISAMDARYNMYCDFRDAYVAAHSSLKADQISINKFPFTVYADVHKGGRGYVLMRADKGRGGFNFCGRHLWMTPFSNARH